eukprot:403350435
MSTENKSNIQSKGEILRKHFDDPNQVLHKFNQDKQFISGAAGLRGQQAPLTDQQQFKQYAGSSSMVGGWGGYSGGQSKEAAPSSVIPQSLIDHLKARGLTPSQLQEQQQPQPVIISGAGDIQPSDQVNLQYEQEKIDQQFQQQQQEIVLQEQSAFDDQEPIISSQEYQPTYQQQQTQQQQLQQDQRQEEIGGQQIINLQEDLGNLDQQIIDEEECLYCQESAPPTAGIMTYQTYESPFEQAKDSSTEFKTGQRNRVRIFGDDELRGGRDHYFEDCAHPEQCPIHLDQFYDLTRQPVISETWGDESTASQGRKSLVEKLKQGFSELKDALLGKKEHKDQELKGIPMDEALAQYHQQQERNAIIGHNEMIEQNEMIEKTDKKEKKEKKQKKEKKEKKEKKDKKNKKDKKEKQKSKSSSSSSSSESSSEKKRKEQQQQNEYDQLDEIGDEDIAQEEKIEKPAQDIPYHRDIKGSGGMLEKNDQNQGPELLIIEAVIIEEYQSEMVQEAPRFSNQQMLSDQEQDLNNLRQLNKQHTSKSPTKLSQEVPVTQSLQQNQEEMYQEQHIPHRHTTASVDDVKNRTGEENAIMGGSAFRGATSGAQQFQNRTNKFIGVKLYILSNSSSISSLPRMSNNKNIPLLMRFLHHLFNVSNNSKLMVFISEMETFPMQTHEHVHVHEAPPIIVEEVVYVQQQQPIMVREAQQQLIVNPKNIREADLYSENHERSRVQANTLGGMPLTRNNIPIQDVGTPFAQGMRRPVHEHYTDHAHEGTYIFNFINFFIAAMMHHTHTHALENTDRMVGRAGDELGHVYDQPDALVHADPNAGLAGGMMYGAGNAAYTSTSGTYTTGGATTYNTGAATTYTTTDQSRYVNQPMTSTTEYVSKSEYMQPNTQFVVQNPEYQSSFAQQHRIPNECKFCRDENDLLPHAEHISRGWYTQEYVAPTTTTYVQETVVQEAAPAETLVDSKLPFGGTKPGQYMAQEVPLLYGWGAAPSQRIYKSNEVVGVNYSGATVAAKPHKLSRHERKEQKKLSKEARKEVNHSKLEQQYQGNINERTDFTGNKVFQNVHEPIDSTIAENKIH